MTVSDSFREYILEQLGRVVPEVEPRRMFGGVGIYSNKRFFALISNDTLYFKVDDTTRPKFEAIGMGPFQPYGEDGGSMQYYQVAAFLLDDVEALAEWANDAIGVAVQAKRRKTPRKRRTP